MSVVLIKKKEQLLKVVGQISLCVFIFLDEITLLIIFGCHTSVMSLKSNWALKRALSSGVTPLPTPSLTPLTSSGSWFIGKLLLAHMGLLGPAVAVVQCL